ncbi:MAG: 2Fe-2S iron-sulfur cluster-binding protein [Chloroflexota bacterium]
MAKIKLEIDGKTVEVDEGTTVLQAARKAGIDIPTLCYDERMAPYGGCRLCTVEIGKNKRTRLVASCVYPVEEGLVVTTESERLTKIRKMIIELLLPGCPTGPIQTLAKKYGIEKSRFPGENTGCIMCGLCVRYCAEVKKANAIGFVGRGTEREVAFIPEVASKVCPGCRECFALCPGGKIVKESLDGTFFPPLGWQKQA